MSGQLIAHRGATRITREALAFIDAPVPTTTWKPVKHADLVDALHAELATRNLTVTKEQYAVQRENALLFGVMDLDWRDTGEYAAALGLRTSNDKSMSLQLAVGVRVFVCDNLAFSGDLIALQRKHTAGLDLPHELKEGLDRYQATMPRLQDDIECWRHNAIAPMEGKWLIYEAFQRRIVPIRLFHHVATSYGNTVAGTPTLWSLYNNFTEHTKTLPPATAFRSHVALGKFFASAEGKSREC